MKSKNKKVLDVELSENWSLAPLSRVGKPYTTVPIRSGTVGLKHRPVHDRNAKERVKFYYQD